MMATVAAHPICPCEILCHKCRSSIVLPVVRSAVVLDNTYGSPDRSRHRTIADHRYRKCHKLNSICIRCIASDIVSRRLSYSVWIADMTDDRIGHNPNMIPNLRVHWFYDFHGNRPNKNHNMAMVAPFHVHLVYEWCVNVHLLLRDRQHLDGLHLALLWWVCPSAKRSYWVESVTAIVIVAIVVVVAAAAAAVAAVVREVATVLSDCLHLYSVVNCSTMAMGMHSHHFVSHHRAVRSNGVSHNRLRKFKIVNWQNRKSHSCGENIEIWIETFVIASTTAASTSTTSSRCQFGAARFAWTSLLLVVIIVIIEIGVATIFKRIHHVV